MYFYDGNNAFITSVEFYNNRKNINFNFKYSAIAYEENFINFKDNFHKLKETQTYNLINTFYYSLEKIEEEPVFNWAKNNEIYTGIKDVCDTLSIKSTFFPLILTYWLIISTIYFIYDIILIIFHILHNYIHKLEDI